MDIPVTASSTFMEHALNAPLYLNYGIDLARDSKVFIYGGPTVQFGLASTTKLSGGVGESTADRTYNNYDNKNYSRFNVYLGGGVGFQLSAFQITLGYDYQNSPIQPQGRYWLRVLGNLNLEQPRSFASGLLCLVAVWFRRISRIPECDAFGFLQDNSFLYIPYLPNNQSHSL